MSEPSKKGIARWRRNYRMRVLTGMGDADLSEIIWYHWRQYQATRLVKPEHNEALARYRAARHERKVRNERYRKNTQEGHEESLAERQD